MFSYGGALLTPGVLGEGAYSFTNAEASTLVAAMSVAPNNARKLVIDTFVGALKTAAVWTKIDVMWVLAAHDEQAGRLNWKTPASFTLTAVNSPTFLTDRGFNGNGTTSYLDTTWDRGTNGVQCTQDNAHLAIYQHTSGGGTEIFGDVNASYRLAIRAGNGILSTARMVSATSVTSPAGGTTPLFGLARRNDAVNASYVRDGVEVVAPTAAASTTASATSDMAFLRAGNTFTTLRIAGGSLGAYLDNTESLALYNAWHDYMVAVGADT